MDWDKISTELAKPLDPAAIKPPPQGKFGEYVDGYHVIREANRIFGYDGWSYAITSMELCYRAEVTTQRGPQVRVAYRCTVRATVDGVTREGAAVGTGMAKPDNEGDAHESAVKEAETDAMKRALRSFGNTFGLALYEKDKSKREVAPPEPPFDAPATRDRIKRAINNAPDAQKLDALWKHPMTEDAFGKLPAPMQGELQKCFSDRMAAVAQAPVREAAE